MKVALREVLHGALLATTEYHKRNYVNHPLSHGQSRRAQPVKSCGYAEHMASLSLQLSPVESSQVFTLNIKAFFFGGSALVWLNHISNCTILLRLMRTILRNILSIGIHVPTRQAMKRGITHYDIWSSINGQKSGALVVSSASCSSMF